MFKESRFNAKRNEGAETENGGGVGPLLRASRLRCGEELREVAQILRIRYPYLEAIEDGRFDDLPGPAYAIGFVRAYAEHLGLDSDEVVRRFKAAKSGAEKTHDLVFPSPIPEGGIPGGAVLFVGIVVAVLAYGGWYVSSSKDVSFADLIPPLPERLTELLPGTTPEPSPTVAPETAIADAATAEAASAAPVPAPVPEEVASEPLPVTPIAAPVVEAPVATPPATEVAEISEPTAPPVQPAIESVTPPPAPEPPLQAPPQPAATEVPPAPEPTVAAIETAPPAEEPVVTTPETPSVTPPPPPQPPNRPEIREFTGVSEGQRPALETPGTAEAPPPAIPQATEAPPQPVQTAETEVPPPAETEEAQTDALEETRPQTETDDADVIRPGTAIPEEDAAGTDSQLAAVPTPGSRPSRVYGDNNEDSRILVRAKLDSWIQVRDDSVNRLLLTRLLRAGDIYRVPDRPGLKLLTGNAGALEILVDGETVPSIGPPGRVRRDVPLDVTRLREGTATDD